MTEGIGGLVDKAIMLLNDMNGVFSELYKKGIVGTLTVGGVGVRENWLTVVFSEKLPEVNDE